MTEQLFLSDLLLRPPASFDNFVTGQNDELLFQLQHLGQDQSLYLWGEAGTGKTHLLQALSLPQFFNAPDFPVDIEQLDTYKSIAIDNVHLLNEAQQAVLFQLYNIWRLRQGQGQGFRIIVTSNVSPAGLQCREDLRTRLAWGLVYQLHPLNDNDCRQALLQRAQQKGIFLNNDVLDWIFSHCSRDIRLLFSLLEALDAYSLSKKRPITIPLIKDLLQNKDFSHG